MKVHDIRTLIEQWVIAQNRAGNSKQAEALLALSQSLASADQLTITAMLNKIANKQTKH